MFLFFFSSFFYRFCYLLLPNAGLVAHFKMEIRSEWILLKHEFIHKSRANEHVSQYIQNYLKFKKKKNIVSNWCWHSLINFPICLKKKNLIFVLWASRKNTDCKIHKHSLYFLFCTPWSISFESKLIELKQNHLFMKRFMW